MCRKNPENLALGQLCLRRLLAFPVTEPVPPGMPSVFSDGDVLQIFHKVVRFVSIFVVRLETIRPLGKKRFSNKDVDRK
jgi:hypothetical protein